MSYGFKMACDVTDTRTTGMMKEAEDDLNRIIKVTDCSNFENLLEKSHFIVVIVTSSFVASRYRILDSGMVRNAIKPQRTR